MGSCPSVPEPSSFCGKNTTWNGSICEGLECPAPQKNNMSDTDLTYLCITAVDQGVLPKDMQQKCCRRTCYATYKTLLHKSTMSADAKNRYIEGRCKSSDAGSNANTCSTGEDRDPNKDLQYDTIAPNWAYETYQGSLANESFTDVATLADVPALCRDITAAAVTSEGKAYQDKVAKCGKYAQTPSYCNWRTQKQNATVKCSQIMKNSR